MIKFIKSNLIENCKMYEMCKLKLTIDLLEQFSETFSNDKICKMIDD